MRASGGQGPQQCAHKANKYYYNGIVHSTVSTIDTTHSVSGAVALFVAWSDSASIDTCTQHAENELTANANDDARRRKGESRQKRTVLPQATLCRSRKFSHPLFSPYCLEVEVLEEVVLHKTGTA